MSYWILQHNPELLPENIPWPTDIDGTLDYWHISRYKNDVRNEDMVFIWHAGSARGIYNIAHIVSIPIHHKPEAQRKIDVLQKNDERFWKDKRAKDRLRQTPSLLIKHHYPSRLNPPVLVQELIEQGFGNLPVLQMPQRGIYRVEENIGDRLLNYIRNTRS